LEKFRKINNLNQQTEPKKKVEYKRLVIIFYGLKKKFTLKSFNSSLKIK